MAISLVAGGAGFLGSHLVEALVARGDSVRVLDNFSSGAPANLAGLRPEVPVFAGDLRSLSAVRRAMDGVERVYHFAVPWVGSGPDLVAAAGAWRLLAAARDAGCSDFVYASGGGVYGRAEGLVTEDTPPAPVTPAAREALAGEHDALSFAREFGTRLVRIRLFNVYGPRQGRRASGPNVQRILAAMGAGERPRLYDHQLGPADLTYVDDAVRGCLLAADRGRGDGRVYHIASGRPVSAGHVVAGFNRLFRASIAPELAGPALRHAFPVLPDVTRARVELGFSAELDLEGGLARCVEFWSSLPVAASAVGCREPRGARPAFGRRFLPPDGADLL
jgi:UDP-glucose 4-epimerase